MTVNELIKKLKELPQDYEIILDNCFYGCPIEYAIIEVDKEHKKIWIK